MHKIDNRPIAAKEAWRFMARDMRSTAEMSAKAFVVDVPAGCETVMRPTKQSVEMKTKPLARKSPPLTSFSTKLPVLLEVIQEISIHIPD